ncbi:hypothetical protein [Psychrobacter sp. I-STPA10]|uniref:hypothetical protein n=1 Tax=Psychrobacter sp. I-STPA10 TaxID=2585769 RepID=UPI001E51956E|nr:hypothetical protein [Psychrobacter sp. I-STPA10]
MIILKIIAGLMLIYFVVKLFMWLNEGTIDVDLDSDIGESSGGFFDSFFGGDGGDGGGGDGGGGD